MRSTAFFALLASLLQLTFVTSASAEEPDEICFLGVDGYTCPSDPPAGYLTWAPADLVSPFVLAKLPIEQKDALLLLQEQAISNTLIDHGLPADDRAAVLSWGRDDALAELFALVVQAVEADNPTAVQSQVVEWLTESVRVHQKGPGEHAGAEYVKWAGLDESTYWSLVDRQASFTELQGLLSGVPRNYNTSDTTTATSGYCKYRSPAPYADEYTGHTNQTCFTPCTSWCQPPMPSYDQFVRYGQAVAHGSDFSSEDHLLISAGIARAAIFGGVIGGAGLVALPISVAMTVALAYLPATVLPMLGSAMAVQILADVAALSTTGWYAALPSYQAAMTVFSSSVGAMTASIAFVLVAMTMAILVGMQVADQASIAGKLAGLVVESRKRPDVRAMLDHPQTRGLLFALFVEATLPSPRQDERCDNSRIPDYAYRADLEQVVVRQVRPPYADETVSTRPCLNPPPIPAATAADPRFLVRSADGTDLGAGSPATQIEMQASYQGKEIGVSRVVRLSGRWFVHHLESETGPEATGEHRSLALGYQGWDGREQVAWLIGQPQTGYRFVGVSGTSASSLSLSSCRSEGACWTSSELHYLGPDGRRYAASVALG